MAKTENLKQEWVEVEKALWDLWMADKISDHMRDLLKQNLNQLAEDIHKMKK